MSLFLRPIKSYHEYVSGDAWLRDTSRFTMRVHKPVEHYYGSDPPETFSYTVNPSPALGLLGQASLEDVLIQDTSVDEEFVGFDKDIPGWGFTEFMHLDEYLSVALDPATDSMVVSACVESSPSFDWLSQTFTWSIPGFEELFNTKNNSTTDSIVSPAFGPVGSQWTVHLTPDHENSTIGGYLQPLLNELEQLSNDRGGRWTRSITSFTLKVQSPQNDYGYSHNSNSVNSKTLTGGFIFTAQSISTGWPSLLKTSQIGGCVDSQGVFTLDIEVTWIKADDDLKTIGPAKSSVSASKEEAEKRFAQVESKLKANVEDLKQERDELVSQVVKLEDEAQVVRVQQEKSVLAVEELKQNLAEARESEIKVAGLEQTLKNVKAKVAALRASMEPGVQFVSDNDGHEVDEATAVGFKIFSSAEQENQFFVMKARTLILEAELASAQESIRAYKVKTNDYKLLGEAAGRSPSPNFGRRGGEDGEEVEGVEGADVLPQKEIPISVSRAVARAREEIEAQQETLNSCNSRLINPDKPATHLLEKANNRVDIAFAYAEVALAAARLIDSCCYHNPEALPINNPNSEVSLIVYELEHLLNDCEMSLAWLKPVGYPQTNGNAGIYTVSYNNDGYGNVYGQEQLQIQDQSVYGQEQLQIQTQSPEQFQQHYLQQQQQQQYNENGLASQIRELELSLERERTRAEMALAELESHRKLEELKARSQSVGDANSPVMTGSVIRGTGSFRGSSSHYQPLPRGRGDVIPGTWTPIDNSISAISAAELTKLLEQVQSNSRAFPSTLIIAIITFFLSTFVAYATVHIHCPHNPDTFICKTAVPVYSTLATAWHTSAEKFVTDIVPLTNDAITGVRQGTKQVFDQVDKKIKKERERAEREKNERMVAEAAARIEEMERIKIAVLQERELEIEKRAEEIKLEMLKAKERDEKARKELDEWILAEKKKIWEQQELELGVANEAAVLAAEAAEAEAEIEANAAAATLTAANLQAYSVSQIEAAAVEIQDKADDLQDEKIVNLAENASNTVTDGGNENVESVEVFTSLYQSSDRTATTLASISRSVAPPYAPPIPPTAKFIPTTTTSTMKTTIVSSTASAASLISQTATEELSFTVSSASFQGADSTTLSPSLATTSFSSTASLSLATTSISSASTFSATVTTNAITVTAPIIPTIVTTTAESAIISSSAVNEVSDEMTSTTTIDSINISGTLFAKKATTAAAAAFTHTAEMTEVIITAAISQVDNSTLTQVATSIARDYEDQLSTNGFIVTSTQVKVSEAAATTVADFVNDYVSIPAANSLNEYTEFDELTLDVESNGTVNLIVDVQSHEDMIDVDIWNEVAFEEIGENVDQERNEELEKNVIETDDYAIEVEDFTNDDENVSDGNDNTDVTARVVDDEKALVSEEEDGTFQQ
ncbi:hypothetical protein HK100_011912 [Physocladia obscura]|uniref:MATH domain-containing protein n=1 Tax=Physocladia obscura TaxID=109957 RepID=A0AAD5XCV8_9FUNG|nr:hypothetical protein HK100_011912 [Physocladia obscura]